MGERGLRQALVVQDHCAVRSREAEVGGGGTFTRTPTQWYLRRFDLVHIAKSLLLVGRDALGGWGGDVAPGHRCAGPGPHHSGLLRSLRLPLSLQQDGPEGVCSAGPCEGREGEGEPHTLLVMPSSDSPSSLEPLFLLWGVRSPLGHVYVPGVTTAVLLVPCASYIVRTWGSSFVVFTLFWSAPQLYLDRKRLHNADGQPYVHPALAKFDGLSEHDSYYNADLPKACATLAAPLYDIKVVSPSQGFAVRPE